jgi:peroxiredoxin
MSETLRGLLAGLHAERVRSWDPAKLRVNIDQRRDLVAAFDAARAVRRGDRIAPFTLLDTRGGEIHRDDLIADGPAVLIFFRFAGCPACNIALPYYERHLWPALAEAGIPLVAISPQIPDRLAAIRERHNLGFTVASDPDNRLARRLGITYHANSASRAGGEGPGWIGETIGTHSWELPQPAAIILGRDGTAEFVDISPDWLVRTEAEPILAAALLEATRKAMHGSSAEAES